ncbi:MAG: hypothetical protein N2Z73_00495 [Endomicrobia bacterium]|nr:hypothetical protein [Endomicrobiia bacterium]
MKKLTLIIIISLIIPCICFANNPYKLNINLKDIYGNDVDYSKVKIQIIDKNSNLSQEFIPTSSSINVELPYDEYNIIVETKDNTKPEKPTVYNTKYIRLKEGFNTTNVTLTKPTSNNVSFILTNIPEHWTQAKVKLTTASPLSKIENNEIEFVVNVNNGKGIYLTNNFPTGKYKYSISKPDNSELMNFNKIISISNNSTNTLSYTWVKKPSLKLIFEPQNSNLSNANFNNEIANITIKDSKGNTIINEQKTLNGNTFEINYNELNNGEYNLTINLSLNNHAKKEFNRTFSLLNKNRTIKINLPVNQNITTTFSFLDFRTNKPVSSKITIKNNYDELVEEFNNTDNITTNLQANHTYKFTVSADGYLTRNFKFTPIENTKKEITLRQVIK